MKYCPKCKREFDDAINFCTSCGVPLVAKPKAAPEKKRAPQPARPAKEPAERQEHPRKKGSFRKWFLICVAVVIVAAVCGYYYYMNAAIYLNLYPEKVELSNKGEETYIKVEYNGYVWEFVDVPDFVTVEKYDKSFMLKVDANTDGVVRKGTITVKSGSLTAKMRVIQQKLASYLRTSTNALFFSEEGGTQMVHIDTDGYDWGVSSSGDVENTLYDNGDLKVTMPVNEEHFRMEKITVQVDCLQVNIIVHQAGLCPKCDGGGWNYCTDCEGTGRHYDSSPCQTCGGTGKVKCPSCGGEGKKYVWFP